MTTRGLLACALAALTLAACGAPAVDPPPPRTAPVAAPLADVGPPPQCDDRLPSVASLTPGRSLPQLLQTANVQEIRKRGRLIVGTSGDVVLWGARNPTSGKLEGFDILLAQAIARVIFGTPPDKDPPVEFRVINYAQRLPAVSDNLVQEGQERSPIVDLVLHTMTINCKRWNQVAFSSEYYHAGQKILVRADDPAYELKKESMQISDLAKGAKVCVPAGSTNVELLKAKYADLYRDRVEASKIGECLVAFQRGEVDAITGDDTVLAGFAVQDPYARVVGRALSDEPYGIGVDKDKPDLVRFVNAVLQDLRTNGGWQAIYAQTMGTVVKGPVTPPVAVYGR